MRSKQELGAASRSLVNNSYVLTQAEQGWGCTLGPQVDTLLRTTSVLGTGCWGMRVQETEAWWVLKALVLRSQLRDATRHRVREGETEGPRSLLAC